MKHLILQNPTININLSNINDSTILPMCIVDICVQYDWQSCKYFDLCFVDGNCTGWIDI